MKYTVASAISKIERNGGKVEGRIIKPKNPGIGTWGAIDFLVNHHGFVCRKAV